MFLHPIRIHRQNCCQFLASAIPLARQMASKVQLRWPEWKSWTFDLSIPAMFVAIKIAAKPSNLLDIWSFRFWHLHFVHTGFNIVGSCSPNLYLLELSSIFTFFGHFLIPLDKRIIYSSSPKKHISQRRQSAEPRSSVSESCGHDAAFGCDLDLHADLAGAAEKILRWAHKASSGQQCLKGRVWRRPELPGADLQPWQVRLWAGPWARLWSSLKAAVRGRPCSKERSIRALRRGYYWERLKSHPPSNQGNSQRLQNWVIVHQEGDSKILSG